MRSQVLTGKGGGATTNRGEELTSIEGDNERRGQDITHRTEQHSILQMESMVTTAREMKKVGKRREHKAERRERLHTMTRKRIWERGRRQIERDRR